jgi:hypothetical protein
MPYFETRLHALLAVRWGHLRQTIASDWPFPEPTKRSLGKTAVSVPGVMLQSLKLPGRRQTLCQLVQIRTDIDKLLVES